MILTPRKRGTSPQGGPARCDLVEKLCRELYETRNKFLHGNSVSLNNLHFLGNKNRLPLTMAAPLIYAVALRVFLSIETPQMTNNNDYGNYFLRWTWHAKLEKALTQFMKRSEE